MLLQIICHQGKKLLTFQQIIRMISVSSIETNGNSTTKDNLKNWIENNTAAIKSINKEFALPYVDLNEVLRNVDSDDKVTKENKSFLYDFYQSGCIFAPAIDINYIISNVDEVKNNIENRKTEFVDVYEIVGAYNRLQKIENEIQRRKQMLVESENINAEDVAKSKFTLYVLSQLRKEMEKFYMTEALSIPNKTHPSVLVDGAREDLVVETIGKKPKFDFEVADHIVIAQRFKGMRQKEMSKMIEKRNSFLIGGLAELEQALVHYTIDKLKERGFMFISVPNMLHDVVFEGAGLVNNKMDIMVYNLQNTGEPNFALAGTSELGLCAYFANHAVSIKDLPIKVCSVSTCYRRETGTRLDKHGIFRVKQFLKVEMFGVTATETGKESEELLQEFVDIQKEHFKELGLHFDVVNMPTKELGLPAYQKFDIEAWFPGRAKYDEISSASNCTDFQSRRFHILYKDAEKYKFAHTVNATACAVPRMIIALLENGQQWNHEVMLPVCLHRYMNGKNKLRKEYFRSPEFFGVGTSKRKRDLIQSSLKENES